MKKFICSFAFLIYFVFACDFVSHANYLPTVTPNNAVVPDFLHTVAQSQMAQDIGVYSPYKPDYEKINQIVNGRTISNSLVEVYSDNANIDWADGYYFYDYNGNQIIPTNTFTAWGSSDVGNYSYVADKETGEILGMIGRGDNVVSTLQAGNIHNQFPQQIKNAITLSGGSVSLPEIYQQVEIAKNIQNYAVYNADDLTQNEKDFIESYDYHLYCHSNIMGWTLFIPNTCSPNVVTSDVDNRFSYSGYVDPNQFINCPNIFCNDPAQVIFVGGDTSNFGYMRQENNSFYGQNFRYCNSWRNIYNVLGFPTGGYLDFHSPTYSEYQEAMALSEDVVYLMPVTVEGDTENNYYSYTYVTENPPQYITHVNNNYEMGDTINENNYPLNYTVSYPNYETENNYLTTIYNYYTTPSTGSSIGTVDPEDVTDGIPILNNLRYRFPFSIPFDIYDLFSGLAVTRQAPSFDWEIYFPVIDYTWEISFDLSAWDTQAEIFRTCFLILFIIGLAMWSYNHFFGN